MAGDIRSRFLIDGNAIHVNSVQDVTDTLDYTAEQRNLPNPRGEKFWPKWELPPVAVERLYTMYAGDKLPAPPMDVEFWQWVDKKVMSDPDLAYYRLGNTSNPFFLGYSKKLNDN